MNAEFDAAGNQWFTLGDGDRPALLLGGHIDSAIANFSEVARYVEGGKLRALAVLTAQRVDTWKDVPTVAEFPQLGLEKFDVRGWHGILGPAHMPPAIVQTIYAHVRRIVSDPEMQSQWDKMGLTPMIETYDPPAFARFLDDDIAFFEKVGRAVAIEKQ